jgi:hypothetical protein
VGKTARQSARQTLSRIDILKRFNQCAAMLAHANAHPHAAVVASALPVARYQGGKQLDKQVIL